MLKETKPTKSELFTQVLESYSRLIQNVTPEQVIKACERAYEEGMTFSQLAKASYKELYPPKEPSLW
jgi:hypothetical protein